jgi:tripartite-type tricarboxylate transporter receptor subunit TctC
MRQSFGPQCLPLPVLLRRRPLLGAMLTLAPAAVRAAEWPDGPLRMIVAFAAGSTPT